MSGNNSMPQVISRTHYRRKPEWLRVSLAKGYQENQNFRSIQQMVKTKGLNTVCAEAKCPNIHECWGTHRTATFMILGDTCTRRCRFCAVKTGLPQRVSPQEPSHVAESVRAMGLRHVVITMVNRDDLQDGGATMMAATVETIRTMNPSCTIEVLSSDLMGDEQSIEILCKSNPEIISHNLETVRRLTPRVRSRSDYDRSLQFLKSAHALNKYATMKSSMMLGLGESYDEIVEAMSELLDHDVTVLNLGQYLQPTSTHLPVQKYWHPDEFAQLREAALQKGFSYCESGPLVRSSYHAADQYNALKTKHPLYK